MSGAKPTLDDIQVIFDCREHFDFKSVADEVLTKFKQNVCVIDGKDEDIDSVTSLRIADIVFIQKSTKKVLALVEHKQLNDYLSSQQPSHLAPKRLVDQLARMKESGVPTMILLLTGEFHTLCDEQQRGVVTRTVRLMGDTPQIQVVRLEGLNHMALFIARMVETLVEKPVEPSVPGFHELMVAVRKSQVDTPEKIYAVLLQLVPGISKGSAQEIYQTYPNLSSLKHSISRQGPTAITKLKHRGRSINKKSAQLLVDLLTDAVPSF